MNYPSEEPSIPPEKIIKNLIGKTAFTVEIDESPELEALINEAKKLRLLPFEEKLEAVKKLCVDAMENAYEGISDPDQTKSDNCRNIVYSKHPLSKALKEKQGCCRYQGALFFILAFEADLGDAHFLQAAPVKHGMNTVFNELVHNGKRQIISIFNESLKDKSMDYSSINPKVYEQAYMHLLGHTFYSYRRTDEGLVMVANLNEHYSS